MAAHTTKPEVKTFLIADTVIKEAGTNKWSAIGIFDRIHVRKFPYVHPQLALYMRIADAMGKYDVRVEFVNEEGKKLGTFGGINLTVHSKLHLPDCGLRTQNLMIPKPGKYHFDLYFNDELCASIPLVVDKVEEKSSGPTNL